MKKIFAGIVIVLFIMAPIYGWGQTRTTRRKIYFRPAIFDDPSDNAQLTAAQCNGVTIITNDGAGAGRTYILPVPAAGHVCMVYLEEAQDIDLDPDSSYQIYVLTNAAGDKISSDATQGSCIKLIAHDATGWWPYGRVGAWADAN